MSELSAVARGPPISDPRCGAVGPLPNARTMQIQSARGFSARVTEHSGHTLEPVQCQPIELTLHRTMLLKLFYTCRMCGGGATGQDHHLHRANYMYPSTPALVSPRTRWPQPSNQQKLSVMYWLCTVIMIDFAADRATCVCLYPHPKLCIRSSCDFPQQHHDRGKKKKKAKKKKPKDVCVQDAVGLNPT